jgi:large subunit ribosomal protein L21
MYAIIETGGKQFRVEQGSRIRVERLRAEVGSELTLDKVLLVGGGGFAPGTPYVEGAVVRAEVLEHGRGEKVLSFKKRRRKDSRSLKGHRQEYTALKITSVSA